MTLLVTYEMPGFTSRKDAEAMAMPHGLTLIEWEVRSANKIAKFTCESQEQVDSFIADLSYHPLGVETVGAK